MYRCVSVYTILFLLLFDPCLLQQGLVCVRISTGRHLLPLCVCVPLVPRPLLQWGQREGVLPLRVGGLKILGRGRPSALGTAPCPPLQRCLIPTNGP